LREPLQRLAGRLMMHQSVTIRGVRERIKFPCDERIWILVRLQAPQI
jgi:hypothetical protein